MGVLGEDERGNVAAFSVRIRRWPRLASAGALAALATAWAIGMLIARPNEDLAVVFLVGPTLMLGAAFHRSLEAAGAVELVVDPLPGGRTVRVTLERRWGLLPWATPLVFESASFPNLVTRWEEDLTRTPAGLRQRYRRASLVLEVGNVEIALPELSGPNTFDRDAVITPLAHDARVALATFRQATDRLRKEQAELRRTSAPAPHGIALPLTSEAGAFHTPAAVVLVLGIALTLLLALGSGFVEQRLVSFGCATLVVPTFGVVVGLVACAASAGRTLRFVEKRAGSTTLTTVADLWLFGPLGFGTTRARAGEDARWGPPA